MRLYYMTSEKHGLLDIEKKNLKVSTIAELNDPFELLGASLGEHTMREALKILRKHWEDTLGILCFTEDWENPVMWAHYADKHRGLCLGFDVIDDPEHLKTVDYVPDRLKGTLVDKNGRFKRESQDTVDFVVSLLTTKYKDWSYEREHRLFTNLNDKGPDGRYFFDFGDSLVLREVILGSRCNKTVREIADAIKKPAQDVTVIKARPAFNSFRIVRQQEVPAITVNP